MSHMVFVRGIYTIPMILFAIVRQILSGKYNVCCMSALYLSSVCRANFLYIRGFKLNSLICNLSKIKEDLRMFESRASVNSLSRPVDLPLRISQVKWSYCSWCGGKFLRDTRWDENNIGIKCYKKDWIELFPGLLSSTISLGKIRIGYAEWEGNFRISECLLRRRRMGKSKWWHGDSKVKYQQPKRRQS